MKTSVNIKVRNPEWFRTKEKVADSKNRESMSREEWEILNKDKIPKYSAEAAFEISFEVNDFRELKKSKFHFPVNTSEKENFSRLSLNSYYLENVTVVGFIGAKDESYVIISDDLIFSCTGPVKKPGGKLSLDIILKEDTDYVRVSDNVWLSYSEFEKLNNSFEDCTYVTDPLIKRKKLTGPLSTLPLNCTLTYTY